MNGPGEAEPRSAKEYARLTVRDTGVGMDQEPLRHLFEPFYTTKEGGVGTGLGLATVYAIVRKHAGFIRMESEPGKGSELAIHLPLRRPQVIRGWWSGGRPAGGTGGGASASWWSKMSR